MTFQASNLKRNQFLDLVDDDNNIIEPTYVIQIYFVYVLQEPLQIIPLLANSDLGSFLGRNSNVHAINIPLKQDIIFYINVVDLIDTGIQEGTC